MGKKNNKMEENKKIYNNLTKVIRKEIDSIKDEDWLKFIEKKGNNPLNKSRFGNV